MRSRKLVSFVSLLTLLIFSAPTPSKAEELSEVQKLKAENYKLKVQVAQLKVTLAEREQRLKIYEIALSQQIDGQAQKDSLSLTVEQTRLVEEFRKTLKAEEREIFNWDTFKFEKPKDDK